MDINKCKFSIINTDDSFGFELDYINYNPGVFIVLANISKNNNRTYLFYDTDLSDKELAEIIFNNVTLDYKFSNIKDEFHYRTISDYDLKWRLDSGKYYPGSKLSILELSWSDGLKYDSNEFNNGYMLDSYSLVALSRLISTDKYLLIKSEDTYCEGVVFYENNKVWNTGTILTRSNSNIKYVIDDLIITIDKKYREYLNNKYYKED